jgi:hypothetical protein
VAARHVSPPAEFYRFYFTARVHRLFFSYDLSGTTVEVLAIVAKSEADSWLAQFGNPE